MASRSPTEASGPLSAKFPL